MRNPRVLSFFSSLWARAGAATAVLALLMVLASWAADHEARRQEHLKSLDDQGVAHV